MPAKSKIDLSEVASTLATIASQVSSPSLTRRQRRMLQARNERVPDALIEAICDLAEQNDGQIVGMAFDAATARATLTRQSQARAVASFAKMLLQRVEDDAIQQRSSAADPAFAVYMALRRLVNTEAGNGLGTAYLQMKAIVKNRPTRPRKKASAKTPGEGPPGASTPE